MRDAAELRRKTNGAFPLTPTLAAAFCRTSTIPSQPEESGDLDTEREET